MNTPRVYPLLALAAVMLLVSPQQNAAPICRWVDESGRTQVASAVPDLYRETAVCTDSQKYEVSPAQRQSAEQRVAEDRARADAARRPAPPATKTTRPAAIPSRPNKRPVETVTDATDCPTWWRLYDESSACFGPYRTTRGATRAEAFDACNVIVSPEAKCGPRSN